MANTTIPTQVAQMLHQPAPQPARIVKLYPSDRGILALDDQGTTYIAVQGQIDKTRLYWNLLIPALGDE